MYIQKYIQKIHKISSCSVRLYKLFQMFPIIANNYATLASLSPPLALKQTIHSNSFHHCFYKFNNQALDLPHFKIFKNSAVRVKLLKNVKCAPLLECAAISLNKTNLEKIPPMGFDGMKNKHVISSWPFLSTLSIINTLLSILHETDESLLGCSILF